MDLRKKPFVCQIEIFGREGVGGGTRRRLNGKQVNIKITESASISRRYDNRSNVNNTMPDQNWIMSHKCWLSFISFVPYVCVCAFVKPINENIWIISSRKCHNAATRMQQSCRINETLSFTYFCFCFQWFKQ